jgi:hypothetical protein
MYYRVDTPGRAIDSFRSPPPAGAVDSIIGDADDESSPPINDSTVFSCRPKSFGPRDTLTLQLETPHGGYLAVKAPDEMFYLLVQAQPVEARRKYLMVPAEEFAGMSTLRVPGDIRLPPYYYGRDTIPEAVFRQRGAYTFSMGEVFGSDHAAPPFICTVTFTP